MNRSLIIGLIAIILLLGIYFLIKNKDVEYDKPFSTATSIKNEKASESPFSFLKEPYNRIEVEKWKPESHYAFKKDAGDWKVGKGVDPQELFKVDQEALKEFMDKLGNFEIKPKEISRNPENRYRYGVDSPDDYKDKAIAEEEKASANPDESFDISEIMSKKPSMKENLKRGTLLTFWNDNQKLGSIILGRPIMDRRRSMDDMYSSQSSYVRLVGEDVVYELKEDFGRFFYRDVEGWRDKKIVHVSSPDIIEKVDVKCPGGDFLLAKESSGWVFQDRKSGESLSGAQIDAEKVKNYLQHFENWNTSEFATKDELKESAFSEKIIAPTHRIQLTFNDGSYVDVTGVPAPEKEAVFDEPRGSKKPEVKKEKEAKEPEEYYFVNSGDSETVFKLRKWALTGVFEQKVSTLKVEPKSNEPGKESPGMELEQDAGNIDFMNSN